MTLITGDDGQVLIAGSPMADITGWTFRTAAAGRRYSSSATAGYERSVPGAKTGRGAIRFQWNADELPSGALAVGEIVTLRLDLDDERHYSVPALIEAVETSLPIDGDDLASGTAEFASHGAWTEPVNS